MKIKECASIIYCLFLVEALVPEDWWWRNNIHNTMDK